MGHLGVPGWLIYEARLRRLMACPSAKKCKVPLQTSEGHGRGGGKASSGAVQESNEE